MLKKIFTAITALALVATLLAGTAGTAAAASGYDSAYFGESAFLTLAPGASGQFAVGFNNTGSTGWLVGSSSQVDLTVCLADKVTCNVTSPNAAFASSWLSSTAYATSSTTYVGPGQTGFFVYNVTAPSAAAAGTYRFNGDLALHGTASMIHQQGYYQDADVAVVAIGPAPVLTSLTPSTGTNAGGTAVVIDGTGFVCTPTTPTVNFGANAGTVTSCGATSITVTSPAGANGTVQVTVANAGGAASNGLPYTYSDTTGPTFASVTAKSTAATLTFSEAVCQVIGSPAFTAADVTVTVNGLNDATLAWTLPTCDAATAATNGVTSFIVTVTNAFLAGDDVFVTLTAAGAAKVQDAAGNPSTAQTREAIATADTTAPSISTAAPTSTTTIKLTYSERVRCAAGGAATAPQFTIRSSTGTPVAQPATNTNCAITTTGGTSITLTFANAVTASGTVTYASGADPVLDLAGNAATTPQTVSFAAFTADTASPLSQDIRVTTNGNFNLDTADVFTVAFNEVVVAPNGATIRLTDADGTVADVICAVIAGSNATCAISGGALTIGGVSYPAGQVLTVTMTAGPTIAAAGTVANLQLPATVTGSLLIADTSGNNWDIAGSPDKILN